jgi:RNA polymerase sigma-70 factor (ECF subfamily)
MPLPDFFNPERRSLERLKAGDLEGLRWIYDQYAERLLNQCHRILLSREQAEDVVQDLFIRLPDAVREFRGESALGTWLYRVAHNMCLTRLQQAGNRQRLLEENLAGVGGEGGAGGEGRDAYEVSDLLAKALAVLDPETRSLLWLKEGEGLPLKELSEIFKLPEGTLKSRLSRARDRVREFLEKEERVGKSG